MPTPDFDTNIDQFHQKLRPLEDRLKSALLRPHVTLCILYCYQTTEFSELLQMAYTEFFLRHIFLTSNRSQAVPSKNNLKTVFFAKAGSICIRIRTCYGSTTYKLI